MKAITLNDIAQKLNYSTVTISKALRGHPDISIETTRLIKKTAEDMGYTPNLVARNLSARKTNTIGVVVPKIAHFFFSSIIEEIYNIAFNSNYEIILTVSQENAEREKKLIQTLLSMKVDGIIISISQETEDYEIFMDRIPQIENVNTVRVQDRKGAFNIIEHAIKLGYRNIAHFAGYSEINIGKERLLGFQDAMNKYNIPINPDWVFHGGFGERYGYESLMKLYNDNNLPDLIFTVTYPVALGVYMAAHELGLNIPNDIDLVCFGNAKVQNFLSPPLSCVDQSTQMLAAKSMEIIMNQIDKDKTDNIGYINSSIPTNLILRGTCIHYNRA